MCAASALHNRAAVVTSVSSTGWRSKVERLMTWSTSLVAVWYSSDSSRSLVRSRNSPSSRAFSIAITACAAKFCNNAICLSEKGRTSCRYIEMNPSSVSSLRKATQIAVRPPPNSEVARIPGLGSIAVMSAMCTIDSPETSFEIGCRPRCGSPHLGRLQCRLDDAGDADRDPVLQLEDVLQRAVETVGPQMRTGECIDQLAGDANPLAGFANRAFEDVANAELSADLVHINGAALIGEGRIAGDHEKPADA